MQPAAYKKEFLWNEIDLITQIQVIIDAYNHIIHGDEKGEYIKFNAAYPDYVFDNTDQANMVQNPHKLICYDIVKKSDGSLGEKQNSSKTRVRPVKMEDREIVVTSEENGTEVTRNAVEEVYAKRYDVTYRFDCLAPSDKESMELIRTFERMMEIHAEYLERGCHRFMYNGRRASYFNRDTQYKSRTCEFFAQVEEQWYTVEDKIQQVNIEYLSLISV